MAQAQTTHKPIELTAEGQAEIQEELRELKEEKLPAVIRRVAAAREHGDLLENAEYQSARDDQQLIETRIAQIEDILAHAQVVKGSKSHAKVSVGSTVVVHQKGAEKTKITFYIVGEFEAAPMENKISTVAPIGKALMNKKKGDAVVVKTPAGETTYVIDEIK